MFDSGTKVLRKIETSKSLVDYNKTEDVPLIECKS